ncbi:unnamed protein product, partial [Gongylonema pulchrum]
MFKLGCHRAIVECVDKFRAQYPNWQHEVPFLLQRLGLQYRAKKATKRILKEHKKTDEKEEICTATKSVAVEDVSQIVKKEIQKAARKEEALEKKKKKAAQKTKSNEPVEKPAPVFVLPKPQLAEGNLIKGQV